MALTPMALLPGTLDALILKAASWRPEHGYGLARLIETQSSQELRVDEGALYQSLHRLERQGLLAGEWGTSNNNRKAKYYRLTSHGRARLRREVATWHRYAKAVELVLGPA